MKKIKIITILLAIISVSMIAFLGVYTKVQNRMENTIKNYSYAMDINGVRNVRLKVNKENKTIIKDKDGKEVEDSENLTDEQIAQNGYTKEETPYNPEEVLTKENYEQCKNVIENRLKKLNVYNYTIKLDEETGDIVIELTENDNTDSIIGNIYNMGDFKIVDSTTKEVLMDNSDIKSSTVMYGSNSSTTKGGTSVYLDIEFNKEGSKKLEDISNNYTESNNTAESTENATNETSEEQTTEGTTTENSEKKITMLVDDQEIMSTSFDQSIKTGKLQLSIGQASTDNETLQEYAKQASSMATVLDTGKIPVKYDVDENEYILPNIDKEQLHLIKYIAIGITAIGLVILIIRYKTNGLLGAFSLVGLFSIMLLLLKYANVVLSIEGLFAIALVLILEYIFINKILQEVKQQKKEVLNKELIDKILKQVYVQFFINIIPICIAVITFCFIKWIPINSFGTVMFWGIVLIAIYNFIVTGSLLKIKTENK